MRMAEEHERRLSANTLEHDVVVEALWRLAASKPLEQRHDEPADAGLDPSLEPSGLVSVSYGDAPDFEAALRDIFIAEQTLEDGNGVGVVVADEHAPFAGGDGSKERSQTVRGLEVRPFHGADSNGFREVAQYQDPVIGQRLDEREEILECVIRPLELSRDEVRVRETERGWERLAEVRRDRQVFYSSEAPSGRFDAFQRGAARLARRGFRVKVRKPS